MFFSQDILCKKGGRLSLVWIAANFNNGSGLNLSRREYCSVDIGEACDEVVRMEQQFALRLSASLMVGIVRIHSKQTHYVYVDSKSMWQRLRTLLQAPLPSAIDLPQQRQRSDAVTLPDPLKSVSPNSSFSFSGSLLDLSLSDVPLGSDSDFIFLDIDTMLLPPVPDTPETRPGSVAGSPFTADPRDITICEDEGTPLESLQIQVPGEKDFGDSEMISGPVAMLDDVPMPMLNLSSDGEEEGGGGDDNYSSGDEDGVLLFDDEMGSFRVYEDGKQPTTPTPETLKKEEEENAKDNKGFVTPFSSSRHNRGGDAAPAPQRRYRRPCLDKETKMSSSAIRENIDSAGTTLTNRIKLTQKAKANWLLSQPTCDIVRENATFLTLWKRCACKEIFVQEEFDLEDVNFHRTSGRYNQHIASRPGSTLTTPDPMEVGRGQNISDLELMRADSRNGELSSYFDGALSNNTNSLVSDVSTANSTRNVSLASFNASSAQRKSGHSGKLLPPTMGGLSPIIDEEGEMDTTTGGDVGLPLLDVSYGSPVLTAGGTPQTVPSSPFIESEPAIYCRHIAEVMGEQTDIEFQELLPYGSTRKTASRAFSHVLALVSQGSLEVEQQESYGAIVLSMPST